MRSQLLRPLMLAVSLAAVACLPQAAACAPAPLDALQTQLLALSIHAPGEVGIVVRELSTGLSSTINAGADMPAASTIKIPVMVEVFRRLRIGDISLTRGVTLRAGDRDWGWGDLASAPIGSRYSVNELLRLMITKSDNTATNMLIRLVGRQAVNATMHRLGMRTTRLADYIRSDGDIRAIRTSPADMAKLLTMMADEKLIDAWSSRAMLAILSGQTHNGLIPAPLPHGLEIAHKTGTLHDTLNDVGVVFLGENPYVIAVMTTELPNLDVGRQFIRNVSRRAYVAFAERAARRTAPVPELPTLSRMLPNVVPQARVVTPIKPFTPALTPLNANTTGARISDPSVAPTTQPSPTIVPQAPPSALPDQDRAEVIETT